ncbi:hypothetical protein SH1V18_23150 [Vallitalea longa]|uniref:Uncharacterized protein n=1 Tax=Vallitalea longa TaxID=2936439 RepID=A0A9W6DES7_9FIRM|nr:hypothetical protein [Vallitalea longa]GKX29835.1 hypothetical protein SH1V18_23150 [Vallitalea longa]
MRKIFSVLLISIIILTGSSRNVYCFQINNSKDDMKNQQTNDNFADNKATMAHMEITKSRVDLDKDGVEEIIKVVLNEGKDIGDNKYSGKLSIQIINDDRVIDEISLGASINDNLIISKDFKILTKDYTNDDILDFNIGYQVDDDEYYNYEFFTYKNKKIVRLMFNEEPYISSYFNNCSNDFPMKNDCFSSFNRGRDFYVYNKYKWDRDRFILVNTTTKSIDYKKVDSSSIENKIKQISNKIENDITEKNILKLAYKQYSWLLDNYKYVDAYLFMNEYVSYEEDDLITIIYNRINQLILMNQWFGGIGINNVMSLSKQEFMKYIDNYNSENEKKYNYKEYKLEIDNKKYSLLVGNCKYNIYILLYDDKGTYLDGYSWLNRSDSEININYMSKQQCFSVKPICKGYGTGISQFGEDWYEIYNNKLIRSYEFLTYGYCSPPQSMGYTQEYELIKENYNNITGNYSLKYLLSIGCSLDEEIVGIEKTINYQCDTINRCFNKISSNNTQYEELFSDDIGEKILEQKNDLIEKIINVEYEDKECNMETITVFLSYLEKSQTRDRLLQKAKKWYIDHEDAQKEYFLQIIDDALVRG